MVKKCALCLVFAFLFVAPPLGAEPKITFEINKISEYRLFVNYGWRVNIISDKAWDGCTLKISFRDKAGKEIYKIQEVIKVRLGQNEFNGTDICDLNIWKRVNKSVVTLDCVF
jgi:hypothetical protein